MTYEELQYYVLRKHLTSLNRTLHLDQTLMRFSIHHRDLWYKFQKLSMKGQTFFSFLSTYECSLRTFLLWHDPSSKEKSFSWFFEDTTKIVEKGGQEPLRKCGLLVQPMSQWNGKNYRREFLVLQPILFSLHFKVTKTSLKKDKFDVFGLVFSHQLCTFEFDKWLG